MAGAVLIGLAPLRSGLSATPNHALRQAAHVAGNRAAARDRALDDAFRNAIDQALAYVLDRDTRTRAQAALGRDVLARARGYARSFRVLDEREVGSGTFQVQIEAQVDLAAL